MAVYIIHLQEKLGHVQHYTGWAKDVEARIAEHRATTWIPCEPYINEQGKKVSGHKKGDGANFMGVVNYFGIPWEVALVVRTGTRAFERKLKETHSISDYCPLCHKKPRKYKPKKGEQYGKE